MKYYLRKVTTVIQEALSRGKSILLLGPRQTGKTTIIKNEIKPDISYSLIQPRARHRYESNPSILGDEIKAQIKLQNLVNPVVAIDEIQKVPILMDVIQDLIDNKVARFVLTGSSARKLKYGSTINLLPGRINFFHLDPLLLSELDEISLSIEDLLMYGSLPGIINEPDYNAKSQDLESYVSTYLEEEIRAEALVRNLGNFSKFLALAAEESGQIINYAALSQAIGVSRTTIIDYFQILEDCLIIERIEPLIITQTRKRLSKSPKFLFFDLGIRRLCAKESSSLPNAILGKIFEQWVGLELCRNSRFMPNPMRVCYWRDHNGPEVDYVLQYEQIYIPIEVKWTELPKEKDSRHLKIFLQEYPEAKQAYIICRTPHPVLITPQIIALPWQQINLIFEKIKH